MSLALAGLGIEKFHLPAIPRNRAQFLPEVQKSGAKVRCFYGVSK